MTFSTTIILISFMVCGGVAANELAPFLFNARVVNPKPDWQCSKSGMQCLDCNHLQQCGSNFNFEYKINCAAQFPGRPYCDPQTNTCVADKDVCQEMEIGFKCPDRGLYPDVEDCQRLISCGAKGAQGVLYNCMYNSVYNHTVKRCITKSTCYTPIADCAGQYKGIPYRLDTSLYVICQGKDRPLLKDCGSKNFKYNNLSMECEFQCPEEGVFTNPSNSKTYYMCVYRGIVLESVLKNCRDGTSFDAEAGLCITDPVNDTENENPGGVDPGDNDGGDGNQTIEEIEGENGNNAPDDNGAVQEVEKEENNLTVEEPEDENNTVEVIEDENKTVEEIENENNTVEEIEEKTVEEEEEDEN